jgi:hypothetical protein
LDLRAGTVERFITRSYHRVKGDSGNTGRDPDPEARGFEDLDSDPYVFDIFEIHAVGDNLWVFTSTVKPGGNDQQVDVFDAAGRFIDCFFLRFPPGPRDHRRVRTKSLVTDAGFFFVPEQEEDGLVTIGKYKVRGFSWPGEARVSVPGVTKTSQTDVEDGKNRDGPMFCSSSDFFLQSWAPKNGPRPPQPNEIRAVQFE